MLFFCLVCAASAQRYIVKLSSESNTNEFPIGWPFVIAPAGTSTVVSVGWDTNWTTAQYQSRIAALKPQFDLIQSNLAASAAATAATNEVIRSEKIQRLIDLYSDFQQFDDGWKAGTNYNATQLQTLVRKHNEALLLLKPMLKEIYDARQ